MLHHHLPKLYFLHIPKAAGTSFRLWLAGLFGVGDQLPAEHLPELEILGPHALAGYHLYSGHFGWRLMEMAEATGEPIVPITILREPGALYGSGWNYASGVADEDIDRLGEQAGRQAKATRALVAAKHIDIDAYAGYTNMMVRYIAHHGTEVTTPARVTEASLQLARQRLAAMPFFGLVEDWPRSAVLFADTFGMPLRYMERNENAGAAQCEAVQRDDFRSLTRTMSALDVDLYEFACELFNERYRETAEKFGLPHDAEPECFRPHLKRQFLQRGEHLQDCRRIHSASVSISEGLVTQGFPFRYQNASQLGWQIWSSPGLDSSIYLPLQRSKPQSIRLSFKVIMSPAIRAGMEFLVDGAPACKTMNYEQDREGNYFTSVMVEIPALSTGRQPGYSEVSILVPETVFVAEPAFRSGVSFCLGDDLVIEQKQVDEILVAAA